MRPGDRSVWSVLILLFLLGCLLMVGVVSGQDSTGDKGSLPDEYFIIESRHRVFTNFSQVDTIEPYGSFLLGEEEYKVEMTDFNPHLGITAEGDYLKMSDTLYNPAVRLRVTLGDSLIQESWAFFVISSPHFYRDRMFAFKLVDFDLGDRYAKPPLRTPTPEPSHEKAAPADSADKP
jgi:hypothetical protein